MIHKTEAIVLYRADYRETSFLLRLLTQDFGRVFAQAKGARRQKGKFGSSFLPLSLNTVVFYENAHSQLHIVSQADLLEPFLGINQSLERFSYAAYFLEMADKLLPLEEKNPEAFELLRKFLRFLDREDTIDNIVPVFEIKFLSLSGFKPRLDCCVHCAGHVEEESKFSSILGGLLCPRCFAADRQARFVSKGTIASVNHIESAAPEKLTNFKMLLGVRREIEQILHNFIEFHLGKQFKSRNFFTKIK